MTDGYSAGGFRFGDVVSRTFAVWLRNLPVFFLLYFVGTLPSLLITLAAGTPVPASPGYGLTTGLSTIVNSVLTLIVQGMLIVLAYDRLCGQPAPLGAALNKALERFFPLLGAGFCAGFAILFGLLLLIIPGVMLMIRYTAFVAACLIEEKGPLDSLGRSAELTRGYRWPIFGLTLVFTLPVLALTLGISVLGMRIFGLVPGLILVKLWTAFATPLTTTLSVAIYHALLAAKEGGNADRIATVFD